MMGTPARELKLVQGVGGRPWASRSTSISEPSLLVVTWELGSRSSSWQVVVATITVAVLVVSVPQVVSAVACAPGLYASGSSCVLCPPATPYSVAGATTIAHWYARSIDSKSDSELLLPEPMALPSTSLTGVMVCVCTHVCVLLGVISTNCSSPTGAGTSCTVYYGKWPCLDATWSPWCVV
jgi:hypothetical protein